MDGQEARLGRRASIHIVGTRELETHGAHTVSVLAAGVTLVFGFVSRFLFYESHHGFFEGRYFLLKTCFLTRHPTQG